MAITTQLIFAAGSKCISMSLSVVSLKLYTAMSDLVHIILSRSVKYVCACTSCYIVVSWIIGGSSLLIGTASVTLRPTCTSSVEFISTSMSPSVIFLHSLPLGLR